MSSAHYTQRVELGLKKFCLGVCLLVCFIFLGIGWVCSAPGLAEGTPGQAAAFIRLAVTSFDPLQGLPDMRRSLVYTSGEVSSVETFLVQFTGPILPKWKRAVVGAGGGLGDYVPDYACLAHLPNADVKAKVEALPFVRWVGPYEPAYKVSPYADLTVERSYRVVLAPWAEPVQTRAALKALNTEPRSYGQGFTLVLDQRQLEDVAHLDDVIWVEPYYQKRAYNIEGTGAVPSHAYNDVAGADILEATAAWARGYNGDSVTIAVADTGLDTGDAQTVHQDFRGRVTKISSWPVVYANYGPGCEIANAGADDGPADLDSGHGTHVTGSAAGDGSRSEGVFKGLGYKAGIVFQAIEQYTTWTHFPVRCPDGDDYYVTGIPDDVRDLLDEAYRNDARIHNDSWGGGAFGAYDITSQQFDDFIYGHPDMTVMVSAGNSGTDGDLDGYVDENSVTSPATAKNLMSVGASESERSTGGYQYTWGQAWPNDYRADPTRSDKMSDNREELAAFSSRGPLADGRIKPDVVAPGTNIISARSSQITSNGWGPYNAYYMFMGGTSMASPIGAGAAALVYDYYVKSQDHLNPSAALIKATLINTAVDIEGYGNPDEEAGQPIPNNHEGWGRINVAAATTERQFVDETEGITTGQTLVYRYNASLEKPFKVTLVWSDYPGSPMAGRALVNDLNLHVVAPDGVAYWGNNFSGGWSQPSGIPDDVNNVENVYIEPATGGGSVAGWWQVEVMGQNIPNGPQPFALVVDGHLSLTEMLTVTRIQPASALNNMEVEVVVEGAGFEETSALHLVRTAAVSLPSELITASVTAVNTDTDVITAALDLRGAVPGWWDVQVTNFNTRTATLTQAFFIKDATLPDLSISKVPHQPTVAPGSWLTYTIVIRNHSGVNPTGVVFSETLPGEVTFVSLMPPCISGTVVLPGGFACPVPRHSIVVGTGVTYTLLVSVPLGVQGVLTNVVDVGSFEADADPTDNRAQAQVNIRVSHHEVYLPLVLRGWSVFAVPPSLYPIENADRNGDYAVRWSPPEDLLPDAYDLEENGTIFLQDYADTSYEVTAKASGVYTYRVRGVYNDYGVTSWSLAQRVVVSTTVPPDNPIVNGDFENGSDGSWTEYSSSGYALIVDEFPTLVVPHGGQWAAWLGGDFDAESSIAQDVVVPADRSLLSFWYVLNSLDSCGNDFAYVMLGDTVVETFDLCEVENQIEWANHTVALEPYGGQSVNLKIRVTTDGDANSNFFVDDVAFK